MDGRVLTGEFGRVGVVFRLPIVFQACQEPGLPLRGPAHVYRRGMKQHWHATGYGRADVV